MTSALTLDDIRAAADKKYAAYPLDIDEAGTIELTNPLRMTQEQRGKLAELKADDYEDIVDYFEDTFALASTKAEAARIRKALGEEPALYAVLFESYSNGVELGEASPSQD